MAQRNRPTLEKLHLSAAQKALRALVAAKPGDLLTRREVFADEFESNGPAEKVQNRALELLANAGLISSVKTGASRVAARVWGLEKPELAAELTGFGDAAKLAEVLYAHKNEMPEEPALATEYIEPTPLRRVEESSADPTSGPDVLEALHATLLLLKTMGDSLAQLHAKVDKLSEPPIDQAIMSKLIPVLPPLGEVDVMSMPGGAELLYWRGDHTLPPLPAKFISVQRVTGQPLAVTVETNGTKVTTTPKHLSRRSA